MADVTVRGAGIFGLTIAWTCLQRGARVRLVDPAGPAAGASGGVVGALAPHVPENWNEIKQLQLDSLRATGPFWAEIDDISRLDSGYGATGRRQPLADAAAVERARARTADAAARWGHTARWRVVPAEGDWPPSPTGLAVYDTLTARLHPARACASLTAALAARGVLVQREAPDAGPVVWATGAAGLDALSRSTGREVGRGIKGQALVLALDRPAAPQLFIDGLHVVPHRDGTVAVGSTTERDFADPAATDGQLDALHARALAACPALEGAPVIGRWAGLRPRARSRAPLLGAWPDRPGHYVANGGFKIGFGVAVECARLVADLVLTGEDAIPATLRPEASLR